MTYEKWNQELLRKQYNIARANNNEIAMEIIFELMSDTIEPFFNSLNIFDRLKYDKEKFDEYYYFMNDIEILSKQKIKENRNPLDYINVSNEELLTFAHDFFADYIPEWYDLFLNVYKNRKDNLRIGTKSNYAIFIPGLDYSYIDITKNETVEDFFNITHEYTHTIVDQIYLRHSYDDNYPFAELAPIFVGLLSYDAIKSTYYDLEKEANKYIRYFINYFTHDAKTILLFENFFLNTDLNNREEVLHNLNVLNKKKEYIKNNTLIQKLSYAIPFMYAVELYVLYLTDPEKSIFTLDKIIRMKKSDNYLYELEKMGLEPNKSIKKLIKSY